MATRVETLGHPRPGIVDPRLPKPIVLVGATPVIVRSSAWQAWDRFSRSPLALLGSVIILGWLWVALSADTLAPYRYSAFDFSNSQSDPSIEHFLGTDLDGRDELTLLLYGSRISIAVAISVPLMSLVIGVPIGLLAGYRGGFVDDVLMRFTDGMFAFPSLLFMVLIISTFGRNLWTILLSLGIASWPVVARLVRGQARQIKELDYVLCARSLGARPFQIIRAHLLPNLIGPVMVMVTLSIPTAVAAEAFLTYVGLGVEPSIPSWGMMINNAKDGILWHPALILFPALAVSSLTLAFSFLGDGLRDALDPKGSTDSL